MSNMNRRLKKVEKVLNLNEDERPTPAIVFFGGGELPPDPLGIHYVSYEEICKEKEQQ